MAIGSNNQYAAGPFKANDLIVNNQAMFSNPGMMALVAKEARKGTSGFFEIPNKERTEAPFLTAAKEKVNQDLEVTSELILIARILHQRFKISNGIKVKENKSVKLAKNEILNEIKNDEYYDLIKNFIKDYRQFRDNSLN